MTRRPDGPDSVPSEPGDGGHGRWWRGALGWLAFLAVALVLLGGRYDFSPETSRHAIKGYLSSAYMLVISLPILYFLLARCLESLAWARAVTAGVAVVCTLPYRWLGLDRLYYHRDRPTSWPITEPPSFDWLPGALAGPSSIPYEISFFLGLAAAGVAVAVWIAKRRQATHRPAVTWWLLLYGLILAQTWLHLSMRNPQVYTTALAGHEKHADNNYFSLTYLFPDSKGAVSRDYGQFRDLEEHFMGVPRHTSTLLIRRAFPLWVTSQLSFFISPFHVFLVLNVLLWFLAAWCAYRFAEPLWNGTVATYFAFLVACGPGFVAFSASPRTYLASYAVIIVLIYLFETLLVRPSARSAWDFVLFGGLLGLGAMVYDIFSLYLLFLGYALLRRLPWSRLLVSLAISLGLYSGFLFLQFSILGLRADERNSRYLGESFDNIFALFTGMDLGEIYLRTATLPQVYAGDLSQAFLVLPLVLALCGVLVMRDRSQVALIVLLGLPSLASIAFLHFGQAVFSGKEMATLPRFAFTAYPAVYLLSAIALDELRGLVAGGRFSRWAAAAPWLVLVAIFALSNVDAFGHPEIYFLFNKYLGMLPVSGSP